VGVPGIGKVRNHWSIAWGTLKKHMPPLQHYGDEDYRHRHKPNLKLVWKAKITFDSSVNFVVVKLLT